jgi:hypothetical protein
MRRRAFLPLLALVLGFCGLLAAPAEAQNRFHLVNNSGQVIEQVYVSPSRVNAWGSDVLGANVLPPGQSTWIVPQRSDCLLDIRVVYAGGRDETRWQINACQLSRVVWGGAGGGGGGGDPSFQFVNRGGAQVNELYVSLSSDNSWGSDRLGRNVLPPGAGTWVALPGGRVCTVDIKVVYADGRSIERRGVETCSVREIAFR